jgi:predicted secreted protein
MTVVQGVFFYLLIWWVTLFMVLPLGVRRHAEEGRGFDAGAPERPDLKKKLVINTVVAGVVLAVIWALDKFNVIQWHQWFDPEK